MDEGARTARALYVSRATVPSGAGPLYHHIGLYAFRRRALERFVKLPQGVLERIEKLEHLRALENGQTQAKTLEMVRRFRAEKPNIVRLHRQ